MPLTRVHFLGLQYFLLGLLLFASFQTPRFLRPVYALVYISVILAIHHLIPVSDPLNDYTSASAGFLLCLRVVDYFVLSDPHASFYRTKGPRTRYASLPLTQKLSWTVTHVFATRGIGWSWSAPHLPPVYKPTVTLAFRLFLLQDVSTLLLNRYAPDWRLFQVPLIGTVAYAKLELAYTVVCLVGMATGLFWTEPDEMRPAFGSLRDAYTVRRWWGSVWHQNLRRPLQRIATVALPPETWPGESRVYLALAMSGLLHWVMAKSVRPELSFDRTVHFFIMQANAVVAEALVKKNVAWGTSRQRRWVGYVWVAACMLWTAPWFFDDTKELGFADAKSLSEIVLENMGVLKSVTGGS